MNLPGWLTLIKKTNELNGWQAKKNASILLPVSLQGIWIDPLAKSLRPLNQTVEVEVEETKRRRASPDQNGGKSQEEWKRSHMGLTG